VRVHGVRGETLVMRLDLSHSFDLEGRPLTYHVLPVYPAQGNVEVSQVSETGLVTLRVSFDPALPLGRIPVVLWAHNGESNGNPTFVSFFFPQPDQVVLPYGFYSHPTRSDDNYLNDPRMEVFRNLRPRLTTSLATGSVTVQRGSPMSFEVQCEDPEGFPTRLYRHAGDRGQLDGGTFRWTPPADLAAGSYPQHLICSDGTGGYSSLKVDVQVSG
jgi:hypothetical protein